jgi:DNA mismatch endonuclease, patch repair protein
MQRQALFHFGRESREGYWLPKLLRNVERDYRNLAKPRRGGWKVIKVWECEVIKDSERTMRKISRFLG